MCALKYICKSFYRLTKRPKCDIHFTSLKVHIRRSLYCRDKTKIKKFKVPNDSDKKKKNNIISIKYPSCFVVRMFLTRSLQMFIIYKIYTGHRAHSIYKPIAYDPR